MFQEDVIRFDVLHGYCALCEAPVYFSRTIDQEGNRVNAIQCWNGHYEHIEIDHFNIQRDEELTREEIEEILPFIGFVRMEEQPGKG
ncbi:hypothetical protein MNBD_NITROSPINAE02-736 [hydrothermal vent metagenome]|uniref:Uncharacterized protein n=1 Tax=hydrothermal vent metagenome TaxID=652676 RepID=A0A3B1CMS7_9ZZZZ